MDVDFKLIFFCEKKKKNQILKLKMKGLSPKKQTFCGGGQHESFERNVDDHCCYYNPRLVFVGTRTGLDLEKGYSAVTGKE